MLLVIVWVFLSCEDPTALSVNKTFGSNDIVTAYVDTFSVITSTVQLDTFPTNGSGVVLLGEYKDPELGTVNSSPYFQLGFTNAFKPDLRNTFDSMVMIMPYNKQFYGDTTQTVTFSLHQLTQLLETRLAPASKDLKLSVFNYFNGFYSNSESPYNPTPIITKSVVFRPHNDSLIFRLPDALGAKWFRLAQTQPKDSATFFTNPADFISKFFYGVHMKVTSSGGGAIAGFKASGIKFRLYYKQLVSDVNKQFRVDFTLQNTGYAFQNIKYDRTGTTVAGLAARNAIPSAQTNHVTYVQAGTGLATKLEFPSVRTFFSDRRIMLNAAYLEIYPVPATYPRSLAPPTSLNLYLSDQSNIPLGSITGGIGVIAYDREYNINTKYTFSMFSYWQQQLTSSNINSVPLILAPSNTLLGSSTQRVIIGDRFHPTSKIKLKIYYSYVPN
jgi:hypothetical protein